MNQFYILNSEPPETGTVEGEGQEGLVGYSPTTFIAGIYFLELQVARRWKMNGKTLT